MINTNPIPAADLYERAGLDEQGLVRLAERVAFYARAGDLVLLAGDLGAGKTTFARAVLRALGHPPDAEVPSPTFTIVQSYTTARMTIAHYDLYRIKNAGELDELGLEDAMAVGMAIVEWPEHGGDRLEAIAAAYPTLVVRLEDDQPEGGGIGNEGETRRVTLTGTGSWRGRLERADRMGRLLASSGRSLDRLSYLQGDASVRRYARLLDGVGRTRVVMDWPAQADGPPIRGGLPYSRLAQLAEGVRPFVGIAAALEAAGVRVPAVEAADLDGGFVILEDLGDDVFASLVRAGGDQRGLWQSGVDVLSRLRPHTPPAELTLSDGSLVTIQEFGARALAIEVELLLDWYWPAVHRQPAPADQRDRFHELWHNIFDRLGSGPQGWVLRDFHSPNLLRLRDGTVGVIDFQDAQRGPHAYDLVSLLQDARVDVPAGLESELLDRYVRSAAAEDADFDESLLRWSYAAMGAQRNAKILGIFARLAHRDGKPGYLANIPRLWGYLQRDLAHPALLDLRAWFDRAFPAAIRMRPVPPTLD